MSTSPKPAAARPYHHGNLRAAIVAAALEVLSREEPSALSLRDLARTVGVRHSALYTHFRDRTQLLAVIAGEGFDALLAAMRAAPPSAGGPIAGLAETYVRFARANPSYYRVMFLPEVGRPENNGGIKASCEGCFSILMEALQAHSGLSEPEARERAIGIWGALHGLVQLGDNSGPLYGQITPEGEVPIASRIARVLAQADWPPGQD